MNTYPLPPTAAFLEEFRGTDFTGQWPTLPELLTITTKRFPDRNCFTVFEPERVTLNFTEARKLILKLGGWMVLHGVKKGDKIAVSGKNSPEWAVTYLAVLHAGATVVPIDYALHEKEIVNLLTTSSAKMLFVDEEKYDFFKKGSVPGIDVYSLNKAFKDTYVYSLADSFSGEFTPVQNDKDDVAAILFTSGTTGIPKGVMLTHENLVSDAYIAQVQMAIFHTDIFYALLPIHHAYTMQAVFIESIAVGAEIVFGKSMAVSRMMKELHEGKITMLLGVPLLFNKLLAGILKGLKEKGIIVYGIMRFLMQISYIIKKITGKNPGKKMFGFLLKKANLNTLRIAICGGGPLAASVFKIYNEIGIDFVQGYGLTETSPIIALNPVKRFKIESVGANFVPYMEMKILDPDKDGIGEICVRGTVVMKGYYNMPEETAEVFTPDGWFKTGDLGHLDDEGYLYLSGRAKNMIVTDGGKNVYPEEIENEFQLCNEFDQITITGYMPDKGSHAELIEALIYMSDDALAAINADRIGSAHNPNVAESAWKVVDKINKELQPYQRVSKITILEAPLEMTTTKKVKRVYTK